MSHVTYEWAMSQTNTLGVEVHGNILAYICIQWSSTQDMSFCIISCHIWISHVTYEYVVSHMNESCHRQMPWASKCRWQSHINASCHRRHAWMGHVTYASVMSHMNMSRMNHSCHIWICRVTYEWVMSQTNVLGVEVQMTITYKCVMSQTSRMNESCHVCISHVTYEYVTYEQSCHIWICRVTYEWVMSHMNDLGVEVQNSFVCSINKWRLHMNESCHRWPSHMSESSHRWRTWALKCKLGVEVHIGNMSACIWMQCTSK